MNTSNGSGKTVLVVEARPNEVYRLSLAAKELCPDISFVFVADAAEALAYLQGEGRFAQRPGQGRPEVLLLNSHSFERGGVPLLEQLRQEPEFKDLKALVWTSRPRRQLQEQAKAAGADLVFRKPGTFKELLDAVRQICDLARAEV